MFGVGVLINVLPPSAVPSRGSQLSLAFTLLWCVTYLKVHFASGNAIARMPREGLMVFADSLAVAVVPMGGDELLSPGTMHRDVAVIGMLDTNRCCAYDRERYTFV